MISPEWEHPYKDVKQAHGTGWLKLFKILVECNINNLFGSLYKSRIRNYGNFGLV